MGLNAGDRETNGREKSRLVSILKNVGKGVVTVISPPIGLPMWTKGKYERIGAAILGVIVSIFGGAVPTHKEIIYYDNPSVKMIKTANNPYRAILELFMSPPLLNFDVTLHTELRSNGENSIPYFVRGKDIITFSKEDKTYHLDLGPERYFGKPEFLSDQKSLVDARGKVTDYKVKLDGYLANGNIFAAREVREKLDKAELDLEETRSQYDEVYRAYSDVVNRMNSELEALANTGIPTVSDAPVETSSVEKIKLEGSK